MNLYISNFLSQKQFIQSKISIKDFTVLLVVLNFQIRLELPHSIDCWREFYSAKKKKKKKN